jgi:sigma-B regulation protein RsbU (phosphoserine phosphatase)
VSDPSALGSLDLAAIVGPFAQLGDELAIAIVDLDGQPLAASSDALTARGRERVEAPIVVADGPVGAVVLTGGRASDDGAAGATASAIAEAISQALVAHTTGQRIGTVDRATIEAELAHGRRLQRSFVSLVPPEVPGYDLATQYEAAREIGGDFFDLFRQRRRGQPLSLVIADVTGKGIAAALLMAFSRPLLHAAIDHARGPAEALERTNEVLVRERHSTLFITALVARLDIAAGRLTFANAGHEPPLFVPGDGGPISLLLGSGPLIGAFDRLELPELEATMRPGDAVLLYTDGVTDARNRDGERFDEAGLFAAIERARGGSAHDLVTEVGDAVSRFAAGAEPADDITMVAMGRRRGARPRRRRVSAEASA